MKEESTQYYKTSAQHNNKSIQHYNTLTHLLIWFFSVKRVVNYCHISQLPIRVFFQSVLLQPLEADLVQTNNKCIFGFASDNL